MDTNKKMHSLQVETKRVLEILSKEIYDSPLALLRENLQNSYDAILMRMEAEKKEKFNPAIQVNISRRKIEIMDNGIGMDYKTLINNFWSAGNSGKRDNLLAKKAGVVGTFGIGAMANFGVCEILEVRTSSTKRNYTYQSTAIKENLKIGEECIETLEMPFDGNVGTTVVAELSDDLDINLPNCIEYLKPYIEFLPIPVYINGDNYSQKSIDGNFNEVRKKAQDIFFQENISHEGFTYDLEGLVLPNTHIYLMVRNIRFRKDTRVGDMCLDQESTNIMGLKNYFGLSSAPLSRYFNLGGYANLSFLSPTAGREALNRESIDLLNSLLDSIEREVAYKVAEMEISDYNSSFQRYIVSKDMCKLGKLIKIKTYPENIEIPVSAISKHNMHKSKSYYSGTNTDTIKFFANENNDVFVTSSSHARKKIQMYFLGINKIQPLDDNVFVSEIYESSSLSLSEQAIIRLITEIIHDDYSVYNLIAKFAVISHRVTIKLEKDANYLTMFISKESKAIRQLVALFDQDYDVVLHMIKGYVRDNLYPIFLDYVPSATKQSAEAIFQLLQKTRELFEIGINEQGDFEKLLRERIESLNTKSALFKNLELSLQNKPHHQILQINQIGNMEEKIPGLVSETQGLNFEQEKALLFNPMPAIYRENEDVGNIKLLRITTDESVNNFKLFVALSDRSYRMDKDVFFQPHYTKIIWGNHKIIYIFGHASNKITYYYEIQLKEKMTDIPIGSSDFPTTTIITKDKIFIPIPNALEKAFWLDEINPKREYYLRTSYIFDYD